MLQVKSATFKRHDTGIDVAIMDGEFQLAEAWLGNETDHTWHLENVEVFERHRGQGLGNVLIKSIVDYADQHHKNISLRVENVNEIAIHLYEKYGFEVVADCGTTSMYVRTCR